jgi:hypothetical protein
MGMPLLGPFQIGIISYSVDPKMRHWIKLIEFFDQATVRSDWKTQYIRYRLGRLKHQYWLDNRKNPDLAKVDAYDYRILQNCQPGHTVFFSSSGYYLKDLWPEITAVEMFPVVKTFYPDVIVCQRREDIASNLPSLADNFAVVNNRADIWTEINNVTEHCRHYTRAMRAGCRFFYSFRDTQIVGINRLKTDMEKYFLDWANSLHAELGLELVWHDINFRRKQADHTGEYDVMENPDTTNGNLKFMFVYQGKPWTVI